MDNVRAEQLISCIKVVIEELKEANKKHQEMIDIKKKQLKLEHPTEEV